MSLQIHHCHRCGGFWTAKDPEVVETLPTGFCPICYKERLRLLRKQAQRRQELYGEAQRELVISPLFSD